MNGTTAYVRFQSTERNRRGTFTGIFGLANGLAREGRLTAEQHRFWRAANDCTTPRTPIPRASTPRCTTPR
jgi:hypothetical protein